MSEVMAYRAVNPTCGHVIGLVVDEPDIMSDKAVNRDIARWLRDGYRLERVTIEEARKSVMCNCKAQEKQAPDLFKGGE